MTPYDGFKLQRLNDLVNNITKVFQLLKEFEDDLIYTSDPRYIARLKRDIKRQKDEIAQYQKEYQKIFSSLSKDLRDELKQEQIAKIYALFQELEQQVRSQISFLSSIETSKLSGLTPTVETVKIPHELAAGLLKSSTNLKESNSEPEVQYDFSIENPHNICLNNEQESSSQELKILLIGGHLIADNSNNIDNYCEDIIKRIRLLSTNPNEIKINIYLQKHQSEALEQALATIFSLNLDEITSIKIRLKNIFRMTVNIVGQICILGVEELEVDKITPRYNQIDISQLVGCFFTKNEVGADSELTFIIDRWFSL